MHPDPKLPSQPKDDARCVERGLLLYHYFPEFAVKLRGGEWGGVGWQSTQIL